MRHARRHQQAQLKQDQDRRKAMRNGAATKGIVALFLAAGLFYAVFLSLTHPGTPLPRQWNPTQPLAISDPVTALTGWKIARAAASPQQCLAVLDGAATLQAMVPRNDSAQCFIRDRVDLRGVGQARLSPIETRCAIALRLAMWERHALQPLAADLLGQRVARINHIGSYNCRTIRTASGPSTRMSTHATADAIDIAGFTLADGTVLRLLTDWDDPGARGQFLHSARDAACKWFAMTLSPDYNRLHADHFHLQSRGWGLCR